MTSDPVTRYLNQRTSKLDRRSRLRIMTGAEFLDVAFRVYQVMGWSILKLTFVPSLFCLAAVTFFFRYVLPSYFATSNPESLGTQIFEMASTTGLALFAAAPLFLIGLSYVTIVASLLVSDFMLGNAPAASAADALARQKLIPLFWLNLRQLLISTGGILVSLGLLALSAYIAEVTPESDATAGVIVLLGWFGFIAGLLVFLVVQSWHAIAPQVMTLEGLRAGESARRSKTLLKAQGSHANGFGSVWSLYSLLGLLFLFVGGGISGCLDLIGFPDNIHGLVSNIPFAPLLVEVISLLPTFLVLWTLMPLWAIATTIIYYDRRIRLEGYDIEALAEDVWRADRSRRFEL